MGADLLPLLAIAERAKEAVEYVEDRIFNVSLYAGLTEDVVQFTKGEPALPEPEAVGTRAKPPRILVVDDMETNRFLLEVFLRRNGFEPELASGGAEAVELASRKQHDAILMDLHMPDVDGFTATQRIRAAEPPGHHTPIIALTPSPHARYRYKLVRSKNRFFLHTHSYSQTV